MDANKREKVFRKNRNLFLQLSVLCLTVISVSAFLINRSNRKTIMAQVLNKEFYHVTMHNEKISEVFADAVYDLSILKNNIGRLLSFTSDVGTIDLENVIRPVVRHKPMYRGIYLLRPGEYEWDFFGTDSTQRLAKSVVKLNIPGKDKLTENSIVISGVSLHADPMGANGEVPLTYLITSVGRNIEGKTGILVLEYNLRDVPELLEKIYVPNLGTAVFVDMESKRVFMPEAAVGEVFPDVGETRPTFDSLFPSVSDRILGEGQGQLNTEIGLFTFTTSPPLPNEFVVDQQGEAEFPVGDDSVKVFFTPWKLVSYVPRYILYDDINRFTQNTIMVGVVLAVLSILGVLFFAQMKYHQSLVKLELSAERDKSIHQSKMATIGEMASGIAHEINNPLAIIVWYCDAMSEYLDKSDLDKAKMREIVLDMKGAAFRVSKIIRSMRAVARDARSDPYVVTSLSAILDDTYVLSAKKTKDLQIRFESDRVTESLKLECRPAEIAQVILNLIGNSCDAVENLEDKWIKLKIDEDVRDVIISVIDSGAGVDAAVKEKLFNPFFTTKPTGHGTGLGLSISQRIIEEHKGSLEIDESQENTTFRIRLPKMQAAPQKAQA